MYLLREDMYNEWSWENGATEIICLSNNINVIFNKLKDEIKEHKNNDRIVEIYDYENDEDIINALKEKKDIYIDIYEDSEDYDNGKNMATLTITYEEVVE